MRFMVVFSWEGWRFLPSLIQTPRVGLAFSGNSCGVTGWLRAIQEGKLKSTGLKTRHYNSQMRR
jgi:hypothetical protein